MDQNSATYEGQKMYDPKGWWDTYVFSQDHKVIALQYVCVALAIGLTGMFLSLLMRMQLGFPGLFESIDAGSYYQDVTMHGMIMVIYLLTALFLGGFGNYLIPLMVGARDMVFPYVNMVSFWMFLVAVLVLIASFEVNCFHSPSSAFDNLFNFFLVAICPAGKITRAPSLFKTSSADFLALILSLIACLDSVKSIGMILSLTASACLNTL